MSKSLDFEQIKEKLRVFSIEIRKKSAYLLVCVDRFGLSGIQWWLRTHAQQDEFKIALVELRRDLAGEEVDLLKVEKTFLEFTVPEEDLGHVYWYTDAHKKLQLFEHKLDQQQTVDIKLLKQAMNELKYIGQSNQFHKIYQLEDIQDRINTMYQKLQTKIVEQQSIERSKIEVDKQIQVAALAKAETDKVAAVAKVKMMEAVKVKEKRLAIIEEKKRQIAERETAEIKMREQNELAEIQAKQAETERQTALQASYQALEIKERAKELPLEELIEVVNQQIAHKKILTFIQLDQISKLKQTIENKKAM